MKHKGIVGALLVFTGAVCFSSKAIMVKLAYQHTVDPVSLLALRMLFSLPFFLLIGYFSGQKRKQAVSLSRKEWGYLLLLGIVGYYLASLFDFQGLQYVTASLERLILFVYPTLVVLISAVANRKPIQRNQYLALFMTYVGIFIAFAFDVNLQGQKNIGLGALLVFGSAFTYALYLFGSGSMIPKVGTIRFTSYAMSISAAAVLLHSYFSNGLHIWNLSNEVYMLSLLMAVVATVIPSFLISGGIKMIGSDNASIVASVGPVSTIVMAYFFLHEQISISQLVGTAFVLSGVLMITLKKNPAKKKAVAG